MAIWAIVNYLSKQPIHVNAYVTAPTRKEAVTVGFKGKWYKGVPGVPSPRTLHDQIEKSYWDVIEVPPKKKKDIPKPPHAQLEFDL